MAEWYKKDVKWPEVKGREGSETIESAVAYALKLDARNRFPEFIAKMQTSYATILQPFHEKLAAMKTAAAAESGKVAILDLDLFTAGVFLGIDDASITNALLLKNGIDLPAGSIKIIHFHKR